MLERQGVGGRARRAPRLRRVRARAIALAVALAGCSGSGPSSPTEDPFENSPSIALEGGNRLVFQDGGALSAHHTAIEEEIRATLSVVRGLLPLDGVTIVVNTDLGRVIREIGLGGFAEPNTITIGVNPNFASLSESIEEELFPLLAHEAHHVARIRAVGYGNHLLGAMVSEGLADHFSIEAAGVDPPIWATALSESQLRELSARAEAEWFNTGYDRDAWFFGTTPSIPRWAGYSIGFDIVGKYLARNPGRRPSDLFAEPAESFIP